VHEKFEGIMNYITHFLVLTPALVTLKCEGTSEIDYVETSFLFA